MPFSAGDLSFFLEAVGALMKSQESRGFLANHKSTFQKGAGGA